MSLGNYYIFFVHKLTTFYTKIFFSLKCYKNVQFKNVPFVKIHKGASIVIGRNTILNSSNKGYHINMFSKCKLYADKKKSSIIIGSNCRIHGTCIHAFKSIVIGDNCLIAANTQIIDANGHELSMNDPKLRLTLQDEGKGIIIEDNVWIAANCVVLGGSRIGEGSVITAGSVVKGIVPPRSIYGGNPATLIKKY